MAAAADLRGTVIDSLQLVGAVRWGAVRYEAHASDAPIVNSVPLWPDDALSAKCVDVPSGRGGKGDRAGDGREQLCARLGRRT